MAIDARHPDYTRRVPAWRKLRDTYEGEDKVKAEGMTYLPPTGGQRADGVENTKDDGYQDYLSYKERAVVPDFVKNAVDTMVGIMHREPARIEVPAALEPMLENITGRGESAHTLLRRINEHQILYGRYGLLLEAPDGSPVGESFPFVVSYDPFDIINWDEGVIEQGQRRLELVVLNESEWERKQDFTWDFETKYRVLIMSNQAPVTDDGSDEGQAELPAGGIYGAATYRDQNITTFNEQDVVQPSIGGRTLEQIPFVFVNTSDLVPTPDEPPILGLANLVLAIYKLEADYRQALHMQAQETFVVIGGELPDGARVGAGAKIELPKDSDAKFVGVSADGLDAMRTALEDDRGRAGDQTTRLMDGDSDVQSGRALNVRLAAKTATLTQMAETGAEALARILRLAAIWIGANPDEVVVEANMDFGEDDVQGQALLQLMQAVQMGLPMSKRSIHRWLQAKDLTEMDFEEEIAEIEREMEEMIGNANTPNPNDDGRFEGEVDPDDAEEEEDEDVTDADGE